MPTVFQHRITLVTLALLAFAGNSILCRVALDQKLIDPSSFSTVRLASGALFLILLLRLRFQQPVALKLNQLGPAVALALYMLCFSFAYQYIETGTGALILFASVQLVMVIFSRFKGHAVGLKDLLGIALALIGLTVLVQPDGQQTSALGTILMMSAGVGWALYTIIGKQRQVIQNNTDPFISPVIGNAQSFILALPISFIVSLVFIEDIQARFSGVMLAVASGALASGAGYAIWYAALKHLTVVQAGVIQLVVPLIAAIGGVIWADEPITQTFMLSATLILTGIYLTMRKTV